MPGRIPLDSLAAIAWNSPLPTHSVVGGRLEGPQLGIDFRVIAGASGKLENQPGLLVALEGRGNGVTTGEILEVVRSEYHPLPWPWMRLTTLLSIFFSMFPWGS